MPLVDGKHPLQIMSEIIADSRRRVSEFGFMGDEDNPVTVDPKKTRSDIIYSIVHGHDLEGRCFKNRSGRFCDPV